MCDCEYCKSVPIDFTSVASIPTPIWLQVRDEEGKYLTNIFAKSSSSFFTKDEEYDSLSLLCKALSVRPSNIHFMKRCDGGFARSTPIMVMKRPGCKLFSKPLSIPSELPPFSHCKNQVHRQGDDVVSRKKDTLCEKRFQKENEENTFFIRPSINHDSLLAMSVEEYAKSIPKFLVRSSRAFDSHLDPPLVSIRSVHKPMKKAPYAKCIFLHTSGQQVETDVYLCTLHLNPAYRPYIDHAERSLKDLNHVG